MLELFKEEILQIKKEGLSRDIATFKLNQELQLVLGSVKNDTHSLKNGQDKINMVTMGLIFLAGLMIGTQVELWSPFVSGIYTMLQSLKG